jgi:hypothetical protein
MSQEYQINRRTEKYDQLFKETIESLDHSDKTAKETLPKMWDELHKVQGIERSKARAMMQEDFGERWGRWSLVKFLPEEAKHPGRRKGGLKSAEGREKRRLDQDRQKNVVILEEIVIDQIMYLRFMKGIKRMKIDENGEVKALD